jgi:4-hydroxy-3-methylbut-2-en-1-yl diphosphate reductase
VGNAIERARGADARATDFRSFDTICSATQDRQDAVKELLAQPLEVMVVVGGYNSSNTISLAAICAEHVTTYHIDDANAIDPEPGTIRHKPIGREEEVSSTWLPASGAVRVGLTAGASTPNNKIGDTVARVFATRGIDPASIE